MIKTYRVNAVYPVRDSFCNMVLHNKMHIDDDFDSYDDDDDYDDEVSGDNCYSN